MAALSWEWKRQLSTLVLEKEIKPLNWVYSYNMNARVWKDQNLSHNYICLGDVRESCNIHLQSQLLPRHSLSYFTKIIEDLPSPKASNSFLTCTAFHAKINIIKLWSKWVLQ